MASKPNIYLSLEKPERQIRLIRLKGGEDGIRCRLETHSLSLASKRPRFVALSYVWGTDAATHEIRINDHSFLVRDNLYDLLTTLSRLAVRPQDNQEYVSVAYIPAIRSNSNNSLEGMLWDYHLWIDAICINQADHVERASQVDLMKDIFASADFVISWLGPEQDGWSSQAMNQLKEYDGRQPARYYRQDPLTKLFRLMYWRRTWIVPEFIGHKHLYLLCGATGFWVNNGTPYHQISQTDSPGSRLLAKRYQWQHQGFLDHGDDNDDDDDDDDEDHRALDRYENIVDRKHITIDRLLKTFPYGLCADPRDRLYSLLGLVRHSDTSSDALLSLRTDYTISPTQLYYRALRHLRYSPSLTNERQWTRFREMLRQSLEVPDDAAFRHFDMLYRLTEHERYRQLVSRAANLAESDDSDGVSSGKAAAAAPSRFFLFQALEEYFGPSDHGTRSWEYGWVIGQWDDFPRDEDPVVWDAFTSLLEEKGSLRVL
jgi:hypothetical protein